jgi:DNA-binding MarR family transcriptional regulator
MDSSEVAAELLRTMSTIRRITRRGAAPVAELTALPGAQLELVRVVRRLPGVSVGEAAEELAVAPNTVSTLVRQLCDAGVLRRVPDPGDRRVARLHLTPDTSRRVEAFRDRRVALLSAVMEGLDESEQERLAGAVEALGELAARLPERAVAGV